MRRIAWAGLMRFGLLRLGLTPEVFWDLTPAELMLLAGEDEGPRSMTRATFADLAARFPDEGRN
ncbi:MAG: phage tail assembly chaperone [Amaricoccus sp.]|uniref:phage tail assembly chaperone n=1 Tax=Amaricoccus sp. TaxID=1872485 RepID=UPI0039E351D7